MTNPLLIGISGWAGSGKDTVGQTILRELDLEVYRRTQRAADREGLTPAPPAKPGNTCGVPLLRFADPVKEMLAVFLGCAAEDLEDRRIKESPHVRLMGATPRQGMITLGEAFRRQFGNLVWVAQALDRATQLPGMRRVEMCRFIAPKNQKVRLIPALDGVGPNHWGESVREASFLEYQDEKLRRQAVFTDVRFPTEADAIRKAGGWVVRLDVISAPLRYWAQRYKVELSQGEDPDLIMAPEEFFKSYRRIARPDATETAMNNYPHFDYRLNSRIGDPAALREGVVTMLTEKKLINP